MSQISRNPLSKESNYEIQATLWWLLARLNNDSDIKNFLNGLLTKTEKIMIAKRLAVAFLLSKNFNYRDISDTLKISTSTISRIKETIGRTEGDYDLFIKKLEKRSELKKLEKQFDRFVGKLDSVVPPQKNDMKGRANWLK